MTFTTQELVDKAETFLYPNYRQPPLVIERGRGAELWDKNGTRYLDLYAGIAVSTLGHAHPKLCSAIAEQAKKVIHLSNYYYNEPNILLSAELCRLTGMDRVFFCNSGTEAIEAMLKLTRRHFYSQGQQQRYHIVAFENSFHGRTLGSLAVTGQPKYRDGFGPLVGVVHVPYGDVSAVRSSMTPEVAGILVEPIQGEGGVHPAPPGFLAALREIADEHGALLLLDEIQTGVGRTGRFLACQHQEVRPDLIALAKGLAGGVPIGALLCNSALAEALPPGSHGSTFGGNPLASACALAVLQALQDEGLVEKAAALGSELQGRLSGLVERYPEHVEGVRGQGLLQALVFKQHVDVRGLVARLREKGVLLTVAGGCALRFSPPLIITSAELDEALRCVEAGLKEL